MTFGEALFQTLTTMIIVAVGAYLKLRMDGNDHKTDAVSGKVEQVHTAINSRLTELVEAVKASAHAAGLEQGRAELANITNKAARAEGKLEGEQGK